MNMEFLRDNFGCVRARVRDGRSFILCRESFPSSHTICYRHGITEMQWQVEEVPRLLCPDCQFHKIQIPEKWRFPRESQPRLR